MNIYFESCKKDELVSVSMESTLLDVLRDQRFVFVKDLWKNIKQLFTGTLCTVGRQVFWL